MLYNPPTGATDPNASYVGKNTAAGQQGSRVPPMAIEAPQREIVAIEVEAGLAPTNTDFKQALRAIRGGKLFTFQDVGTQNALNIQPITPHTSFFKGLPFRIFPAFPCTGPATLTVGTDIARPLRRRDGTVLLLGDYLYDVPLNVYYDGLGSYRLMDFAFGEVPRLITNPTIYVRTDGADTNDGSANDALHAFATLAAAIASTTRIATTGVAVTIQLGIPGVYAAPPAIVRPAGVFRVVGDVNNQAAYTIAGPGLGGFPPVTAYGCSLTVSGVTLSNTGTTTDTITAVAGGSCAIDHVTFTCVAGNGNFHIGSSGTVSIGAGVIIASSMGGWAKAYAGNITLGPNVITFANTPAWSGAGVFASIGGSVTFATGAPTISGSATGARYNASNNAVIFTNGAGANFFPGSTAGATYNGGVYV